MFCNETFVTVPVNGAGWRVTQLAQRPPRERLDRADLVAGSGRIQLRERAQQHAGIDTTTIQLCELRVGSCDDEEKNGLTDIAGREVDEPLCDLAIPGTAVQRDRETLAQQHLAVVCGRRAFRMQP
jgi:hypothetical protein